MPEALTANTIPRCVLWGDQQLTRPTPVFSRGCKLWSKERQFYEEERVSNMRQFSDRPYLHKQYPEIGKHYPGTWRVAGTQELDSIVSRLTRPTTAHLARADHVAERQLYFKYVTETEKAKDIVNKQRGTYPSRDIHSASARLEGNYPYKSPCRTPSAVSRSSRYSQSGDNSEEKEREEKSESGNSSGASGKPWYTHRKYDKWAWAFARDRDRYS